MSYLKTYEALKKSDIERSSWITLYEHTIIWNDYAKYSENSEEYCNLTYAVAFPLNRIEDVFSQIDWTDVNKSLWTAVFDEESNYHPIDEFLFESIKGVRLVYNINSDETGNNRVEINPDLPFALHLLPKGDSEWISPNQWNTTLIKTEKVDGSYRILIQTHALKDYLCARGMFLLNYCYSSLTRYSNKKEEDIEQHATRTGNTWLSEIKSNFMVEKGTNMPATLNFLVTKVGHKELYDDDVPVMRIGDCEDVQSYTVERKAECSLFRIMDEYWKKSILKPSSKSHIVRRDPSDSNTEFVVSSDGRRANVSELVNVHGWLWFEPEIINDYLKINPKGLCFYTHDTGRIISSSTYDLIRFGINKDGLINVYAKDIAGLTEFAQRKWFARNVNPSGGVSSELQMAQVKAQPAETMAPEEYIKLILPEIDKEFSSRFSFDLFRIEDSSFTGINRFVALDDVCRLAKNVTVGVIEAIDSKTIKIVFNYNDDEKKLGSLKTLEKLLARFVLEKDAERIMSPLFAVYDLRLSDSHSIDQERINRAYELLGISATTDLPIFQGTILLEKVAWALSCVYEIISSEEKMGDEKKHYYD